MKHFPKCSFRNRNFLVLLLPLMVGLTSLSCTTNQMAIPSRAEIHINTVDAKNWPKRPKEQSSNERETLSVSLEEAVDMALMHNPKLQTLYAHFEQLSLHNARDSSLPDPKINYSQFVDAIQTRTGEQEFIIGVSQTFPWFGQLRLKGEMADYQALQALETYKIAMLDIRKQVLETAYRLDYEKAAMELAQEDRAALEKSLEVVSALYTSAQRGREALLKTQTELALIENELTAYPARIAALESELSSLLFDPRRIVIQHASYKEDRQLTEIPVHSLIDRAKQERPEMKRISLEQDIAHLEYDLAKKDDYPDITLGMHYIGIGNSPANPSNEGDDAWNIGIGFNIPIPNARRNAMKQIAITKQTKTGYKKQSLEERIQKEITSILPELKALQQQQSILQTNLIPLAEEAFEASRISYESGRATFLDLLDAQRTYIRVRADLLKVQRDFHLAIANLERAIGGQFASIQKR